ncbi:MAG: phosphotransferase [Betaproteobacteria bacterium]|nr:phosphotransferase [Betaproteobacteria bacterium]MBL8533026.1 phosphotransferase [Betaproteobacteria bacterium]
MVDDQQRLFRLALERMGLVRPGESLTLESLAGGVSSDIFRAVWPQGSACVKRALPKLKVKADWQAPVERNRWEVEWMRVAGAVEPSAVPAILGEDSEAGMFAMAYLDPDLHPVWKLQLRDGIVDPRVARAVGRRLAHIHAATAADPSIPERFATDHIFHPIRLEPYLVATAHEHPEVSPQLLQLVEVTASTKRALVHGDVSPKNILVGPDGPVFLDAECAWFGDPAFDVAFCLNHLLLKCLWRPQWWARYLDCFSALYGTYLGRVTWESRDGLEARIARLLPGLFLARVDGKSPAEYITEEADRDRVRRVACQLLLRPVDRLSHVSEAWRTEVGLDPRSLH